MCTQRPFETRWILTFLWHAPLTLFIFKISLAQGHSIWVPSEDKNPMSNGFAVAYNKISKEAIHYILSAYVNLKQHFSESRVKFLIM